MNSLFSKAPPSITKLIRLDHKHVLAVFQKWEHRSRFGRG